MSYFKYFLFVIFFVHFQIHSQTNLSVGSGENLTVSSGEILTINNVTFEPTTTVSFSNTNITESTNSANTTNIDNINKVLRSSGSIKNFTGQITVGYTAAQLNGINESSLQLSFFDLVWNPSVSSVVNTGSKTVRSSFSGISFSEITLQGTVTTTPTTTPITTPSSSGGGGGVTVNTDRDGDGIPNSEDAFPDEPNEWLDTDGDGIGDNADLDDDNDGISDLHEGLCFTDPKDPFDVPGDYDADGLPNCIDLDDDADGYSDEDELLCGSNPLDETATPIDTDEDFLANCIDPDDDNDSYLDADDAFPLNELEWVDTDGDEIGNNEDTDDDNDCYSDTLEVSQGSDPLDSSSIPADADLDCIPDELDPDDNNDGYPDGQVLISEFVSPNGDGINDTWLVKEINRYPNNEVRILTRSGFEVFYTQGYKNDWSGTRNGSPLPEGSYYYRIDLEGNGSIEFEGWLYLSR